MSQRVPIKWVIECAWAHRGRQPQSPRRNETIRNPTAGRIAFEIQILYSHRSSVSGSSRPREPRSSELNLTAASAKKEQNKNKRQIDADFASTNQHAMCTG